MGNMTHHLIRTKTNIGEIGEASDGQKSYFFLKPQKNLDEIKHLSQLNLEKNNKYFNEQQNFRNYLSFEPNESVLNYYLTKLEGEFFIEKLLNLRKQKKKFSEDEIKKYLQQLLQALYQLHQLGIPGRIFSVYNIFLTTEDKIVLFDYGCASKIEQEDLPIYASPEYLKKLLDKEVQLHHQQFDLKFDIWMIGVFLYHLLQRKPICCIKNELENKSKIQTYRSIERYYNHILTKNYSFHNDYSNDLQQLIKSMLNVDISQRIDFYQLYQNQYIKQLDLPQSEFYSSYYYDKKFLYPEKIITLKLQSYIQMSISYQSTITNQISQSDEPQMESINYPKKQTILEFELKDDHPSIDFLFYLKIFCLKILLLEKLEQEFVNKPILKAIKAFKSQLELKFYYMILLSFSLHNSQITKIFQCFNMNYCDVIQLFRLKQVEEQNTLLVLEDLKFQEFIQQQIITQFQNLDQNNPLIFLCCIYYSDPFSKNKIREFIQNQNLTIFLNDFPYYFYQSTLEQDNQQFKNNLFNYLKEKYKKQQ